MLIETAKHNMDKWNYELDSLNYMSESFDSKQIGKNKNEIA